MRPALRVGQLISRSVSCLQPLDRIAIATGMTLRSHVATRTTLRLLITTRATLQSPIATQMTLWLPNGRLAAVKLHHSIADIVVTAVQQHRRCGCRHLNITLNCSWCRPFCARDILYSNGYVDKGANWGREEHSCRGD